MANMQTRVPSDGWGDVDEMTSRATVDLLQWLDEEERREGDPCVLTRGASPPSR